MAHLKKLPETLMYDLGKRRAVIKLDDYAYTKTPLNKFSNLDIYAYSMDIYRHSIEIVCL